METSAKKPDDQDPAMTAGKEERPALLVGELPANVGAAADTSAVPDLIPETGEYPQTVVLTDIYVDPKFNIRDEYEPTAMTRLAESFSKRGQFQSVLVQPKAGCSWWNGGPNGEPFLLIQGFRRYFSAIEAKKKTLIVIVKSFTTREDALAANMEENIQHEPISYHAILMRIKEFTRATKLLNDPIKIASDESIDRVARVIADKCGAQFDLCQQLVTFVERVSPEILDKLRYDETVEQLTRIELVATVGGTALSREEKFRRQLEWWKREGWKSKNHNKPAGTLTARQEFVIETAQRIKSSRILKDAEGKTHELTPELAAAVCNALEWAIVPKSIKRKAPL